MRTFVRKKKNGPPRQTDAPSAAARGDGVTVATGSPVQAIAVELRTRHFVRHIAADSAEPDPYAFDVCDEGEHAPGEGSQHDPAFLESLVARSGSSLSEDVQLDSASPPDCRVCLPNGKGMSASGRCAPQSPACTNVLRGGIEWVGRLESQRARGATDAQVERAWKHGPRRACSCIFPRLSAEAVQPWS